ncbi:hypothetical protein TRICI_006881 [Trichomonascus ciferrii]|uniref:Uncharacterized protein n=1 Tax=Trichomonascus ciferrii TaxID=44093 RepID=A0A6A1LN63_9ASCO|nr:hypothetical protein TRICI_006881 [Trichomonascus ciferrii]
MKFLNLLAALGTPLLVVGLPRDYYVIQDDVLGSDTFPENEPTYTQSSGASSPDGIFKTEYDVEVISSDGRYEDKYLTPKENEKYPFVGVLSDCPDSDPYYVSSDLKHGALIWQHNHGQYYSRTISENGMLAPIIGNGPMPFTFVSTGIHYDRTYLNFDNDQVLLAGKTGDGNWYACESNDHVYVKYDTSSSENCQVIHLRLRERTTDSDNA